MLGEAETLHSSIETTAIVTEPNFANERENRLKAADYFHFVETVEEIKMMEKARSASNKPSFIKLYNDEEDWTEDHFFHRDGRDSDICKIILTSYQVKTVMKNCSTTACYSDAMPIEVNGSKVEDEPFYYIKAQKPVNAAPVPNFPKEGKIFEYLNDLQENNQDVFADGCTFDNVLEYLSAEELEDAPQEVQLFAENYRRALVDRDLKKMFKPLYDWQGGAIDRKSYELSLGLGHIRQIYEKKGSGEKKILNAPLIEVPVDVDEESLKVVPVKGGRLKWNGEAKASLLFARSRNKKILTDFQTLVANGSPVDVILHKPETFLRYLEKASQFLWEGHVKQLQDHSIHQFPEVEDPLVLTPAWCIFVRPKRSNSISNDAHAMSKAFEETNMGLSLPLRSLIVGPDTVDSRNSERISTGSSYFLPLPASNHQLKIIQKVFSEINHVLSITGPPGTGKTQTGLNMASIVLQRGSTCLVTSDNAQALEAFERKLPEKLSIFCVNVSSMEEEGIGKLSQTLDSREADLEDLHEKEGCYEKEIKMLSEDIIKKKEQRRRCMDELRKRCRLSQSLMKTSGFNRLVQHALRGDAEISRVILSILCHKDLDVLSADLRNLLDKQILERREPIPFRWNNSGTVTQDSIEFAKKKAMQSSANRRLVSTFHSDSRGQLLDQICSFELREGQRVRQPSSADDWARVTRGLILCKTESDFKEIHVKALVDKGCQNASIFGPDGLVSRSFIANVTDVQESLLGVEPGSLNTLLKFLEDVSTNRKSQESQKNILMKIRQLEEELVYQTTALKQSTTITTEDLSNFSQLKELASRMKDSEIETCRASDATSRRRAKFVEKFRKSLGCMPLLLMTTKQVSRYIPVDHRFQLVIADEATQSPSTTALTIQARAEQLVVIGDSRQTLPKDKDSLSEESRSALEKCQGDLDHAEHLLPVDQNSLYDFCQNVFPRSRTTLRDHFRCPPDGMSWSNKNFYANKMTSYKPSATNATLCLKVTKNGKRDMAKFVHDLVKTSLSSGSEDQVVLTVGVIMMGQKNEVKTFKTILDDILTPLEDQYGTEALDRHSIKVATPEDFQGQERDIILIGCVPDNLKVPYEKNDDPTRKRLWNVATTRHKRCSEIFSCYDLNKIKRDDLKREIFQQYKRQKLHTSPGALKEGQQDIRSMSEHRLSDQLELCGYKASRNEATIWHDALCIGLQDSSVSDNPALITIENYGESENDWTKVVDQQVELEEAGTACLRVDALALSLCFRDVFQDVVAFLKEKARLSPLENVVSDVIPETASDSMTSCSTSANSNTVTINSGSEPLTRAKRRKCAASETSNKKAAAKRRKDQI